MLPSTFTSRLPHHHPHLLKDGLQLRCRHIVLVQRIKQLLLSQQKSGRCRAADV